MAEFGSKVNLTVKAETYEEAQDIINRNLHKFTKWSEIQEIEELE